MQAGTACKYQLSQPVLVLVLVLASCLLPLASRLLPLASRFWALNGSLLVSTDHPQCGRLLKGQPSLIPVRRWATLFGPFGKPTLTMRTTSTPASNSLENYFNKRYARIVLHPVFSTVTVCVSVPVCVCVCMWSPPRCSFPFLFLSPSPSFPPTKEEQKFTHLVESDFRVVRVGIFFKNTLFCNLK